MDHFFNVLTSRRLPDIRKHRIETSFLDRLRHTLGMVGVVELQRCHPVLCQPIELQKRTVSRRA